MARRPSLLLPTRAVRARREQRTQRILANRAVADSLVSVAGLVGRPVRNQAGREVGRMVDVVCRWDGAPYPPVTGVVVRVGRRLAFIAAAQVDEVASDGDAVRLRSARIDLRDFEPRTGEVTLVRDVIDHQLIDIDGVRVVRASDLYLARVLGGLRLVGVDVGFTTLLRRLGPRRRRARSTPDRVIDWATIQPFGAGEGAGAVRLRAHNQELHRLRPAELADLLEELGRPERQELLRVLGPDAAADALEEMNPEDLGALLRESSTDHAADLVANMEPDEAIDALRDLDDDDREELLAAMPRPTASRLRRLLLYPEASAGGIMTTHLVLATPDESVGEVRERLRSELDHRGDIDGVILVDDDGRVLDDLAVFELLVAGPDTRLGELAAPPWPLAVGAEATLPEVVEQFVEARGSSLLVIDDDGRPLGRILADDVVDALVPDRGHIRVARLVP